MGRSHSHRKAESRPLRPRLDNLLPKRPADGPVVPVVSAEKDWAHHRDEDADSR